MSRRSRRCSASRPSGTSRRAASRPTRNPLKQPTRQKSSNCCAVSPRKSMRWLLPAFDRQGPPVLRPTISASFPAARGGRLPAPDVHEPTCLPRAVVHRRLRHLACRQHVRTEQGPGLRTDQPDVLCADTGAFRDTGTRSAQLAALALRHIVPAINVDRQFALGGGLMSRGGKS